MIIAELLYRNIIGIVGHVSCIILCIVAYPVIPNPNANIVCVEISNDIQVYKIDLTISENTYILYMQCNMQMSLQTIYKNTTKQYTLEVLYYRTRCL